MGNENRLLVVAAHPDDEVLGCGATVRRLVDQGWAAHLVTMTAGVSGRYGSDEDAPDSIRSEQENLRQQMQNAADIIGFSHIDSFDFSDNRMDTVSRADLAHSIRPVIESVQPKLVMTHHPGDYNWDHTRTFDAVMMAARPNPPEFAPQEIRTFEVLSSTERAWQEASRAFHPNLYVDVAATLEAKKQALLRYESELRPFPHPRSIEAIENLAGRRGNEVGLLYAEAFHIVRKLEV